MMKGWKSLAPNIGRCWSDVDDDTSPSWMSKEMEWMILRLFWSIRISNFENHGGSESGGDSGRVWNEVSPAQLKTLKINAVACITSSVIFRILQLCGFLSWIKGFYCRSPDVCWWFFRKVYIWIHNQKISSKKNVFCNKTTKGYKRSGTVWCTDFSHKFPTVLALLVPLGMRFFAEKLMFSRTVSLQ